MHAAYAGSFAAMPALRRPAWLKGDRIVGQVITDLAQVTPAWLTEVYLREKLIGAGHVVAIATQPNPAFNSAVTHLAVTFSDDVPSSVPRRLLLKCNLQADWARPAGVREVQFYQTVAQLSGHPHSIVPCFDAAFDMQTMNSHLLLQDLSESHAMPITRDQLLDVASNVPARDHLEQVIDTLARFHAFWWQHANLGTGIAQVGGWCATEAAYVNEVARRRRAWNDLWEHEQSWFPAPLRALYESMLNSMVALWKEYTYPRLASYTHLTLTHGDSYFTNFLCPRPGQSGATYLIDWQGPEVYRGTGDLVNLCATFWTRARRAEYEGWMLRRYHAELQRAGVVGYTWDAFVADYQYSIMDWLLNTLQDRLDGADKAYWYTKMQCLADAFSDWNGAALLQSVSSAHLP